ncbi:hypothetical protein RV10_GL002986 [Enterococcus pallens]|nr:hypothetical protein RV10_GL002986 [Enterococcus pallens]
MLVIQANSHFFVRLIFLNISLFCFFGMAYFSDGKKIRTFFSREVNTRGGG